MQDFDEMLQATMESEWLNSLLWQYFVNKYTNLPQSDIREITLLFHAALHALLYYTLCYMLCASCILHNNNVYSMYVSLPYSLSKLSWHDRKRCGKGIHLMENGSNKRHVILMGMNARVHYQMPV